MRHLCYKPDYKILVICVSFGIQDPVFLTRLEDTCICLLVELEIIFDKIRNGLCVGSRARAQAEDTVSEWRDFVGDTVCHIGAKCKNKNCLNHSLVSWFDRISRLPSGGSSISSDYNATLELCRQNGSLNRFMRLMRI